MIVAEPCAEEILVRRAGTPLYVYDETCFIATARRFASAFWYRPFRLLFATMANDDPAFLRLASAHTDGACVNSAQHLRLALESGFDPQRIQYTSTAMSSADMLSAGAAGVAVNADSVSQALRLVREFGFRSVGIRVNAASLLGASAGDRIGIDASEIAAAAEAVDAAGGQVSGLHVYLGTNFLDVRQMLDGIGHFFEVASAISSLRYVNIGGGAGVDYARGGMGFDVSRYGDGVSRLAERLSAGRDGLMLFFEPGRALAAPSGTFYVQVTDVKHLRGVRYVGVDGSIAVFPRPFHHPENRHNVRALRDEGGPRSGAVVVGHTTFSRDVLATCDLPDDLHLGDVLAFDDAGAYCRAMRSRFLGQDDPQVIFA